MSDLGEGLKTGPRESGGRRLLDRVIEPKSPDGTPEQRRVYNAAREVLKPFEDFYHGQAADLKKGSLPPGATSNFLKNEYSFKVMTGSGKPVDTRVKIGSMGEKSIMRELKIGQNKVVFGSDGKIQSIVITNDPALPQVRALRKSILGDNAVAGAWRDEPFNFVVKKPAEMKLLLIGNQKYKPAPIVQEDGTLIEKQYPQLERGKYFPDVLEAAMEAIDPSNN